MCDCHRKSVASLKLEMLSAIILATLLLPALAYVYGTAQEDLLCTDMSLRVPVLAPISVAPTSGTGYTKSSMHRINTFPTLSLSRTSCSLRMEQD